MCADVVPPAPASGSEPAAQEQKTHLKALAEMFRCGFMGLFYGLTGKASLICKHNTRKRRLVGNMP